jgi:glyoxylase-like metal-dependent hydrolase (beta-lactamase superfamily II)
VIGLATLSLATLALANPTVATETAAFLVDPIAEGVMLFRPAQPSYRRANSLLVERDDGLLLVDAQPTPEAARELLAAISRVSSRSVRYLVLSHPHAEAAGGASAFPENVLLVASADCKKALADAEYDFGAEVRAAVGAGTRWEEPPRRMPTLIVHGPTDLDDRKRPVHLFTVGQGHSSGDMLLYMPELDLLYMGGLVAQNRNPFAGDANVGSWLALLNNISKQSPKIVVSLHGPVMDVQAVRAQRDAFAWVRGQVESGFLEDLPLERIRQHVLEAPGVDQYFDAQARPSFFPVLVEQVLEESVENRRKRGLM